MKIEIREIKFGTSEYALEMSLRTVVLRAPLGLVYSDKDIAEEANDIHFGAFEQKQLVGCLLLRPSEASVVKMRQVAVDARVQGSGIGKRLVAACEAKAKQLGAFEIQLHARETAVPFYLKLGYEILEGPFTEVGIPHRKMRKVLRR